MDDTHWITSALKRWDADWLPVALSLGCLRDQDDEDDELATRLDTLVQFYRQEGPSIRASASAALSAGSGTAGRREGEETVIAAMRDLCRHPPAPGPPTWAALRRVLTPTAAWEHGPEDWLSLLLRRCDPAWLPGTACLAADEDHRPSIRRIATDDVAARLDRLTDHYRRARPRLVAFAARRLGRHHDLAEDLVHDVMRKVCQSPPALRDPENVDAYLHQAIRNGAQTWGERADREQQSRRGDQAVERTVDEPSADRIHVQMVLARALTTLSARQRSVIVLVDVHGLTVAAAAAELGVATGTAQRHRFDGLRRLRDDPQVKTLWDRTE